MGILKTVAEKVFRRLPLGNYIIFESAPDLSDSTKSVFEEMLRRGLNEKYKLIWWINDADSSDFKKIKNVKYIKYNGLLNKFTFLFYRERAKCIVECNRFLVSTRKGQVSIYIAHGTPLKSTRSYYNVPHEIDYLVVAGDVAAEISAYEYNYPINRIYSLGLPRNDELLSKKIDINSLFASNYSKIVVWYPTYRQHKSSKSNYNGKSLPIIHDVDIAKQIDIVAKKLNMLIVLKPHFAQDVKYVKDLGLENIKFINDEFFMQNDITSYEFVGNCDAMITDYSSIYFDYSLCNKPMALVLEDLFEYKEDTGLINNFDEYTEGAVKIRNYEEMISFLECVANEIDELKDTRNEVCGWANYSRVADNTTRVTDFVIQKSCL